MLFVLQFYLHFKDNLYSMPKKDLNLYMQSNFFQVPFFASMRDDVWSSLSFSSFCSLSPLSLSLSPLSLSLSLSLSPSPLATHSYVNFSGKWENGLVTKAGRKRKKKLRQDLDLSLTLSCGFFPPLLLLANEGSARSQVELKQVFSSCPTDGTLNELPTELRCRNFCCYRTSQKKRGTSQATTHSR